MWGAPGICFWSTFFLLYINDINKIVAKTEISLFADDTAILGSFPTLRTSVEFKNDLGKTYDWCIRNIWSISSAKCKISNYGKPCLDTNFTMGGENVSFTKCFIYLGVQNDHQLRFNEHVKIVCKKLATFSGITDKGRCVFSKKKVIKVLFSLCGTNNII